MRRVPTDLDTDARLDAAGAWCLKLADGALEPAERARFQAWLDADPENRRALEDAVGVWRAVGDTSLTPELLALRRDALTGFEDANRARLRGPRRRGAGRWKSALAAAACLALVVGGAWIVHFAFAPIDYRTGIGERRVAVLRDGSRLSLDAETEVKVRYSDGARRLWLERGRAKFDVAKDPRSAIHGRGRRQTRPRDRHRFLGRAHPESGAGVALSGPCRRVQRGQGRFRAAGRDLRMSRWRRPSSGSIGSSDAEASDGDAAAGASGSRSFHGRRHRRLCRGGDNLCAA